MQTRTALKTYSNPGNTDLMDLTEGPLGSVLDVGCGTGGNARICRRKGCSSIVGITLSTLEAAAVSETVDRVWVCDLDVSELAFLGDAVFDTIICSHVLEHLREPWDVVARLYRRLRCDGTMLIAVPNLLYWRQRVRLLLGHFEYEDEGIMDIGHLRFFTFATAAPLLLHRVVNARVSTQGTGSVPLGPLRRLPLTRRMAGYIDAWGVAAIPNLFAHQVLIRVSPG